MPAVRVVSIDNTVLVRRDQLRQRITKLSAAKLQAVCGALQLATGCDRTARP
jgi:mRNA-degrading endonuclease toxin of MazEF toxin-antitoxin module